MSLLGSNYDVIIKGLSFSSREIKTRPMNEVTMNETAKSTKRRNLLRNKGMGRKKFIKSLEISAQPLAIRM